MRQPGADRLQYLRTEESARTLPASCRYQNCAAAAGEKARGGFGDHQTGPNDATQHTGQAKRANVDASIASSTDADPNAAGTSGQTIAADT